MSSTQLLRIAVALVVLLAAWGGIALWRSRGRDQPARFTPAAALSPAAADRVEIARGPDTVRLEKRGAQWTVNGFQASEQAVLDFFSALADTAASSELVAQNASSHERMGLDSLKAGRVTVTGGGKTLVDLYLGNRGPDFEGGYLRRVGEPAVYLLGGRFRDLADRGEDLWRERLIAKVTPDSVATVEVTRGRKRYTLKRGAPWRLSGEGPADSAAVARLLSQFAELRATGFPTRAQSDSADFRKAERRVRLLGPSGMPLLAIALDSSTAGAFWVRADSGGSVYKVDQRLAEMITPAESFLRGVAGGT